MRLDTLTFSRWCCRWLAGAAAVSQSTTVRQWQGDSSEDGVWQRQWRWKRRCQSPSPPVVITVAAAIDNLPCQRICCLLPSSSPLLCCCRPPIVASPLLARQPFSAQQCRRLLSACWTVSQLFFAILQVTPPLLKLPLHLPLHYGLIVCSFFANTWLTSPLFGRAMAAAALPSSYSIIRRQGSKMVYHIILCARLSPLPLAPPEDHRVWGNHVTSVTFCCVKVAGNTRGRVTS